MPPIRVERRTGENVAVIVIDRVEAKNAFTRAMWSEAASVLQTLAVDDAARAVVLTAAGDVFCAGADLNDLRDPTATSEDAGRPFHLFLDELDAFPKPIVAAVNGAAVGAGFSLLCYCDLILASSTARFRAPFVAMGLCPEAGSSALLPTRIGWQEAAHLFFTGGWMDAARAQDLGFVLRVVPPDELLDEALKLAAGIGSMPLAALQETKRLLVSATRDAAPARARESDAFRRLLAARVDTGS